MDLSWTFNHEQFVNVKCLFIRVVLQGGFTLTFGRNNQLLIWNGLTIPYEMVKRARKMSLPAIHIVSLHKTLFPIYQSFSVKQGLADPTSMEWVICGEPEEAECFKCVSCSISLCWGKNSLLMQFIQSKCNHHFCPSKTAIQYCTLWVH